MQVAYPHNSDKELINLVLTSKRFKNWLQKVETNGNKILNIDILSVISRKPNTWYAAFIDCLLLTPEGNRIKRCVTIRGEGVVVIPIFRCIEDNELYAVMVEQRCICDGALHVGFPAGNSSECQDYQDLRVVASKELLEETGIEISPDELIRLSEGIVLNSSITDDRIFFYGFIKDTTSEWLKSINNRKGGVNAEGEYIRVRVFTLSDCFKMPTPSTLIGETLIRRKFGISV